MKQWLVDRYQGFGRILRPGLRRVLVRRYRQQVPWLTSPDRIDEVLPGRPGAFLSALGWLFCRESTLLVFSFTFAFLLSIFPLIVLLISLSSVIPSEAFQDTLFEALRHFFPVSQDWIVRNLQIYLQEIGIHQVISLVLLAWAGSGLFFALEAALESAYRVRLPRNFVGSQIRGTALVLALGVLAMLAATVLHGSVWLAEQVFANEISSDRVFTLTYYGITYVVTLCLLICAFHWLPNREAPLRHILPEALFAATLIVVADLVFRWLAPQMGLEEVYGPFFVSVTILLWGYTFGCIIVGSARLGANGFFMPSQRCEAAEREARFEQAERAALETRQSLARQDMHS
ncbi:MAG: YihY/virulence factor BrkB family protein [Wenzhouxiangellaceae bacterium]|nr:MAG: YihY/virulence factor BrkB family protein [Wenzhouxiangellaceae bacterium]